MDTAQDSAIGIIPVCKQGDRFLFCLVKHADGHWGFPKGHKEEGESDEGAALRELREETGIGVVQMVPDKRYSEQYFFELNGTRYDKTVTYFLGLVQSKSTATPKEFKNEIQDMRWLPYEEMMRTLTFVEGKKEMLNEIWEYLNERLE